MTTDARGLRAGRSWCIWELYHTADSQSKLDLIMSPGQKERFTHTLTHDFDKIMAILSHIDVAAAETRKPEDKQMIMDKVAAGPGVQELNTVIAGLLREWLLRTVREAVESYTGDEQGKALLLNNAARMLKDQACGAPMKANPRSNTCSTLSFTLSFFQVRPAVREVFFYFCARGLAGQVRGGNSVDQQGHCHLGESWKPGSGERRQRVGHQAPAYLSF